MRILTLADTRFPIERANGLQTMATCHALAARGHAVRLLVRPDTAVPARDPFTFYDMEPLAALTVDVVGASSGGTTMRRGRFLAAGLAAAAASSQTDVIYTRDLGIASALCRLPRSLRRPVVYESHGVSVVVAEEMPALLGKPDLAPSPQKLRRLDQRERRVWQRAESYVAITRALAEDLEHRYGARERVFVVPDGARQGDPGGRPPGSLSPVAAYAGHLYPWKGVDVFVRALAQTPNVAGLIVGGHDGEADLARIRALVSELDLGDRVQITGLVPHADVARYLAGAAILVVPNTQSAISERYTSPLKLFEYLTLGKPIVASRLPSILEVLTDGQTALLVPAGDAGALAEALSRLASDPPLAAALGAAALALAPHYTWARRAERLEAALAAAIAA